MPTPTEFGVYVGELVLSYLTGSPMPAPPPVSRWLSPADGEGDELSPTVMPAPPSTPALPRGAESPVLLQPTTPEPPKTGVSPAPGPSAPVQPLIGPGETLRLMMIHTNLRELQAWRLGELDFLDPLCLD